MELYQEILANAIANAVQQYLTKDHFPSSQQLVECQCYHTLQKIKAIIHDDSLSDAQCFMKIDEIICVFEAIGSSGGSRHDFG